MIIDPLTLVPLEMDRRLAGAGAVRAGRTVGVPRADGVRRRDVRRRGLVLRLAAWATGRTAHA